MRRSGVDCIATAPERIVLPRPGDVVADPLLLARQDGQSGIEALKADFKDAFLTLGVLEAERGYVVVTDGAQYFAYRGVPFGLGPAVPIWGRVAAWLSRLAQATVGPSARISTYVDDPIVIACGPQAVRTEAFCRTLVAWTAGGAPINFRKVVRGASVQGGGVLFGFGPGCTTVSFTKERMDKVEAEISRLRRARGLVQGVQQLAGLLSWMATVVPRLRPFVRPLWAAVAAAALTPRRIPRGAAWQSQIAAALEWLARWTRAATRPALRRVFWVDRLATAPVVRTDASTTGMGAVLLDAVSGEPVSWWADGISDDDVARWGYNLNDPAAMAVWETLAVLVSVRVWGSRIGARAGAFRLQADSRAALGAAVHLTSPVPVLNELAQEVALELEAAGLEVVAGEHLRGLLNVEADALSRLAEGAEVPPRLRGTPRSVAPPRGNSFYKA